MSYIIMMDVMGTILRNDGFGIQFWPTPDQGRLETPGVEKQ